MTPVPNQRNKVFLNPQIKIYGLSTNSWEMRDYKERSLKKDRFRIAVLGDSFMEAKHVENGKYMAALMEDLFEHRVEVLNFGVERISTVEEYLMYIPKVRKFSPDIVLLSVLPCNDFSENVEQVHTACVGDRNKKRFAYTDSQGTINFTEFPTSRIRKESSRNKKRIRTLLKKQSRAFCFLDNLNKVVKKWTEKTGAPPAPKNSFEEPTSKKWYRNNSFYGLQVYMEPQDDIWHNAYHVTGELVKMLHDEVKKDHAHFLVFLACLTLEVPEDPSQILYDELGIQPPEIFNTSYPFLFLEKMCNEEKIACVSSLDFFRTYMKKFNVPYPYFSYRNDGHWNPLGHYIAANIVAKYLVEQDMIPGIDKEEKLDLVKKNLMKSPEEILGKEDYGKIYRSGVYIGVPVSSYDFKYAH